MNITVTLLSIILLLVGLILGKKIKNALTDLKRKSDWLNYGIVHSQDYESTKLRTHFLLSMAVLYVFVCALFLSALLNFSL